MFAAYLETFLKKYNLIPKKVTVKYIILDGKNCNIVIWLDGRVKVYKESKIYSFKFSEKKIKKYLPI